MLKDIWKGRVASIVAITLLIVIEVILSMPIPYISKYLVDVVIGLKKYELVGIVFLVLFIILLLQLLIGNILVRKVARLETNLITEYRKRIVKTIVAKREVQEENKSNIQEILLNDVESFSRILVSLFILFYLIL